MGYIFSTSTTCSHIPAAIREAYGVPKGEKKTQIVVGLPHSAYLCRFHSDVLSEIYLVRK